MNTIKLTESGYTGCKSQASLRKMAVVNPPEKAKPATALQNEGECKSSKRQDNADCPE